MDQFEDLKMNIRMILNFKKQVELFKKVQRRRLLSKRLSKESKLVS